MTNLFLDLEAAIDKDGEELGEDGDELREEDIDDFIDDSPTPLGLHSWNTAPYSSTETSDVDEIVSRLKKRCTRGTEGSAQVRLWVVRTSTLASRNASTSSTTHPDRIGKVFSIPSIPGRVYVEARSREDVVAAFPYARLIFRVPLEESIDLIRWIDRIHSNGLQKGTWVQFRRGRLKGDLGVIVDSKTGTDSVTVVTLSRARADLKTTESGSGERLAKRHIQATHAISVVAHPPIEGVLLFYASGSLELRGLVKEALRRESIRTAWQVGDRVEVLSGSFVAQKGQLRSLDIEQWSAEVELQGDANGSSFVSHVPLDQLKRTFFLGDDVLVIAGHCKGRCGIVVSLDEECVTFIEDKTREEVRAWSSLLRSYTPDYSTPLPLTTTVRHRSPHPLIGKSVLVIGRSVFKGLLGHIRAPAREDFIVAVGQPVRYVRCPRGQLVLLETGQALDNHDLGVSWPAKWRSLLEPRSSAQGVERETTPPYVPEPDEVLEPAWTSHAWIPELDDLSSSTPPTCAMTQTSGSDQDGWFLMNPAIWVKLGARKIWVSFSIGFDGGRHFRRRASTQERFTPCDENTQRLNLQWTDCRGKMKRDLVEIQYLNPAPPTARHREGVILTGNRQGELIVVQRYSRTTKELIVAPLDQNHQSPWVEQENNVCWVEPFA